MTIEEWKNIIATFRINKAKIIVNNYKAIRLLHKRPNDFSSLIGNKIYLRVLINHNYTPIIVFSIILNIKYAIDSKLFLLIPLAAIIWFSYIAYTALTFSGEYSFIGVIVLLGILFMLCINIKFVQQYIWWIVYTILPIAATQCQMSSICGFIKHLFINDYSVATYLYDNNIVELRY